MPLTKDFKTTVMARAQRESAFREGLLTESVELMLNGEPDVGKEMIRDLINATIGFENLGRRVGKSPQSLMRMFSSKGNPHSRNLFAVIEALRQNEGVRLEVMAVASSDNQLDLVST